MLGTASKQRSVHTINLSQNPRMVLLDAELDHPRLVVVVEAISGGGQPFITVSFGWLQGQEQFT